MKPDRPKNILNVLLICAVLLPWALYFAYDLWNYRSIATRGNAILKDIPAGTAETDLRDYLERYAGPLGIRSWTSTENVLEGEAYDPMYRYFIQLDGDSNLGRMLGRKNYLTIRIDGREQRVDRVGWSE